MNGEGRHRTKEFVPVPRPTLIYHITHGKHLTSIMQNGGLLCNKEIQAQSLEHTSIADPIIQDRRAKTQVPCSPGGVLHDYVPFYFAPRSPMLYRIYKGGISSCPKGQQAIVYLVSSVEAVLEAGLPFVFTDGHGTMQFTSFFNHTECLDQLDWLLMKEKQWTETQKDPGRRRRRQAEFLVHHFVPWPLITMIGVLNTRIKHRVEGILQDASYLPPVEVQPEWYY